MEPLHDHNGIAVYHGKSQDVLRRFEAETFTALVTDPPAGIGFMGKRWDGNNSRDAFIEQMTPIFAECLRVLRPGAPGLVWSLPRTSHWTAWALEEAGFIIRDKIAHMFGSGFPKGCSISKSIDKHLGAERKPTGRVKPGHEGFANRGNLSSVQSFKGTLGGKGGFARPWMNDPEKVEAYHQETAPATPEAEEWDGYHTNLKPSREDWLLVMKPLDGTFAQNALKWGTGALNIDGCRVETSEKGMSREHNGTVYEGVAEGYKRKNKSSYTHKTDWHQHTKGRWPSNTLLDGSDEVLALFPESKGQQGDVRGTEASQPAKNCYGDYDRVPFSKRNDSGSAARYFPMLRNDRLIYTGKASKRDRYGSTHPTVKSMSLMKWLLTLVKMPGENHVLDPFGGSLTTAAGALDLGMRCTTIEQDPDAIREGLRRLQQTVLAL